MQRDFGASVPDTQVKDLLHPSSTDEKRKHKLKRLVQAPNSFFMDVKCPGCFTITCVFSHAQVCAHPSIPRPHPRPCRFAVAPSSPPPPPPVRPAPASDPASAEPCALTALCLAFLTDRRALRELLYDAVPTDGRQGTTYRGLQLPQEDRVGA